MRILAFDIGDKRTGLAFGDTLNSIVYPVCVVSTNDILSASKNFKEIMLEYVPDYFIFGLPMSLDGQCNLQTCKVKDIAKKISNLYKINFEFEDERLSSKEAKKVLQNCGFNEKKMLGKLDSVAASLILETWIKKNADV